MHFSKINFLFFIFFYFYLFFKCTFRGFTGVRAQALDSNGVLVDELIIQLGTEGIESRILHIRNAPSPAATSSLALSEYIAKSAFVEFEF